MNQFSRWLAGRARVAILMRHAERGHFNHPAEGANVPITAQGRADAESLGRSFGSCGSIELFHSPVGRCRQTADAIGRGAAQAGVAIPSIVEKGVLGGPYLLNVTAALNKAGELGHRFVREWFDGGLAPGLLKAREATAREQLQAVDTCLSRAERGLVVMVTHDWNLLAVREELFGIRHEDDRWPGFLDGLIVWRADGLLHVAFAGTSVTVAEAGARADDTK